MSKRGKVEKSEASRVCTGVQCHACPPASHIRARARMRHDCAQAQPGALPRALETKQLLRTSLHFVKNVFSFLISKKKSIRQEVQEENNSDDRVTPRLLPFRRAPLASCQRPRMGSVGLAGGAARKQTA